MGDIYFLGCYIVFGMLLKAIVEIKGIRDFLVMLIVILSSWVAFGYLLNNYFEKENADEGI